MEKTQDKAADRPGVWQALRCRDAAALIDHLTGLGFVETVRHLDGDLVSHAELRWPEGGGVMLGDHRPGGVWSREPGTAGTYVVTSRIDEARTRVRELESGAAEQQRRIREQDAVNQLQRLESRRNELAGIKTQAERVSGLNAAMGALQRDIDLVETKCAEESQLLAETLRARGVQQVVVTGVVITALHVTCSATAPLAIAFRTRSASLTIPT